MYSVRIFDLLVNLRIDLTIFAPTFVIASKAIRTPIANAISKIDNMKLVSMGFFVN